MTDKDDGKEETRLPGMESGHTAISKLVQASVSMASSLEKPLESFSPNVDHRIRRRHDRTSPPISCNAMLFHIPHVVALMLYDQQQHPTRRRKQQVCQHGLVIQPHRQTRLEQVDIQPSILNIAARTKSHVAWSIVEMAGRREGRGDEGVVGSSPPSCQWRRFGIG